MVQVRHCDLRSDPINHVVMRHTHIIHTSLASARRADFAHSTAREGTRLGLIVGVATWLWLVGFDYVIGKPFHTFDFFGGFMGFAVIHFTLCLAYGWAIIGAVHGSMREPTVMFG